VQTEYLIQRVKGNHVTYLLDWDGRGMDGEKFISGLVDPATLRPPTGRPPAGSQESRPNRRSGAAR